LIGCGTGSASCRTRYQNYYSQSKTTVAQTTVRITAEHHCLFFFYTILPLDKCFTRNIAPVILSCALIYFSTAIFGIFLLFIVNAVVSVWQESNAKSEKALEALKEIQSEHATIKRDGRWSHGHPA
jgi:magnesium-transporting ATPase (P-type)